MVEPPARDPINANAPAAITSPPPADPHPALPPPPTPARSQDEPLLYTPHGLIVAWCLWVLANWIASLTIGAPSIAISFLITACLTGMMALWPALRLSQHHRTPRPAAIPHRVILDWAHLTVVFHAVLWPTWAASPGTIQQPLYLAAIVHAWSLLTAAILAWGLRTHQPARRTLCMTLCMILLFGPPALQSLLISLTTTWPRILIDLPLDPITALWSTLNSDQSPTPPRTMTGTAVAGLAALAAWTILLRKSGTMERDSDRV